MLKEGILFAYRSKRIVNIFMVKLNQHLRLEVNQINNDVKCKKTYLHMNFKFLGIYLTFVNCSVPYSAH
jgi:hypothetical protein